MRKQERGAIAAVMLASLVALSLLFVMAAGAVSQLRFTSHADNAQRAKALAEAAIETTIARLRQDLTFGQASGLLETMPAAEVRVQHGNAVGLLSFHESKAEELEIPVSLNNVDSDAPEEGWRDRVIPSEAVQLVAVGTCGGVSRTVEAVLHVPRFPYVVSSSGQFSSDGPLVLGVLPDGTDPAQLSLDDLLPGHLASNSSVEVRGEAVISGDVNAVESITMVDPATVRGLRKPNSSPIPLAQVRVTNYQPNPAITETFVGSTDPVELAGFYQGSGQVTTSSLDLQGAVLYVDGNLHVTGGVSGKGAVICTGTITIDGTTALVSDQKIALLSQGDVTLNGHGAFHGVVYTEGNLNSSGVKLIGALIANSTSNQGAINLQDTGAVVGVPTMSFDEGWLYQPLTEVVQLPWNIVLGPPEASQVNRSATITQEGDNVVIEWTFLRLDESPTDWDNGFVPNEPYDGDGVPSMAARVGPLPSVREVYDQNGNRLSTNYDEVYGPFWEHYQEQMLAHADFMTSGNGQWTLEQEHWNTPGEAFNPPVVPLQRILADPVLQTFKIDFNQFLKAEENLRLLIRVDQ